jgi:hypothetical protein
MRLMRLLNRLMVVCLGSACATTLVADDQILVIGGGYSPTANQASLEKNVLFFQRMLTDLHLDSPPPSILFADGTSDGADLQVNDLESVPLANRLMAEFFGSQKDLGMTYRNHCIPNVMGASSPENLSRWFRDVGAKMEPGDRLLLYVTAHGGSSKDRSDEHNTTIYMWNNRRIDVRDLCSKLDTLPEGVAVVSVMVQCHAGGFARYVFDDPAKEHSLSRQNRCGFFATVHSRSAAGCTPEIDEADYQEYSSFFWAALGGKDRLGNPIEPPDYDQNGVVSFAEAHAYTVIHSDTIDLPICTSGEFLRVHSRYRDDDHPELLPRDASCTDVFACATAVQRVVLEELSRQLSLDSEQRLREARNALSRRGSADRVVRRRGGAPTESRRLRDGIARDIRRRWPELANVLSPGATQLLTSRSDQFIAAVESHSQYQKYREALSREQQAAAGTLSPTQKRVKYERLLRVAENVILAHNLTLLDAPDERAAYEQLTRAESESLLRVGEPSLTSVAAGE